MSFFVKTEVLIPLFRERKKNILYNPFASADFEIVEVHCNNNNINSLSY